MNIPLRKITALIYYSYKSYNYSISKNKQNIANKQHRFFFSPISRSIFEDADDNQNYLQTCIMSRDKYSNESNQRKARSNNTRREYLLQIIFKKIHVDLNLL